jgi:hypothetical protein
MPIRRGHRTISAGGICTQRKPNIRPADARRTDGRIVLAAVFAAGQIRRFSSASFRRGLGLAGERGAEGTPRYEINRSPASAGITEGRKKMALTMTRAYFDTLTDQQKTEVMRDGTILTDPETEAYQAKIERARAEAAAFRRSKTMKRADFDKLTPMEKTERMRGGWLLED